MKNIKISVIHSKYNDIPAEAWANNENFIINRAAEYIESNINKAVAFMEEAGQTKTDLVCTHEDFTNIGIYAMASDRELFPSLVLKYAPVIRAKMSEMAKRYNMHIATNNYDVDDGLIYNTSTLYGRDGEVIGQHRKVHLADGEYCVAAPGNEFPVFETDIGNIGFFICYDVIFPEACRIIALNGADIVIHQTQGWGCGGKAFTDSRVGESFMRVRAAENSIYLVVAKVIQGGGEDGGRSCVVDGSGLMLVESEVTKEEVISVEFTPDYENRDKYFYDNVQAGVESSRARQMLNRKPELYKTLTDTKPPVIERYKDLKLIRRAEEYHKAFEVIGKLDESERVKFHW